VADDRDPRALRETRELRLQSGGDRAGHEQALKIEDFYDLEDPAGAEECLRRRVSEATGSELEPLVPFAELLDAH
jgi:hypothetical protein